ncbi:MAG: DUF3667 domain-containing protein [Proteobacteria bacterium]|nr:DUF3667 domain-containing protein [Pseudomonadota bacterium]
MAGFLTRFARPAAASGSPPAVVVACTSCGAAVAHAFCSVCGAPRPADALSAHEHHCRNCGAEADGLYCPQCGQETRVAMPTARQFLREAAGRFVALDSRLWRTLWALMVKPGFLTVEYLKGRRARYVRPARLFLFSSIVAFAVLKTISGPDIIHFQADDDDPPATKGADAKPPAAGGSAAKSSAPAKRAPAGAATADAGKPDAVKPDANPAHREAAIVAGNDIKLSVDPADLNLNLKAPDGLLGSQMLRDRLREYNAMDRDGKQRQLKANMFRYGPYAAFAMLPAFALLLQVVYFGRGRRYPQRPRRFAAHLVFAAHNSAFVAILVTLLGILASRPPIVVAGVTFYVLWYMVASLRRVYGGGWLGIVLRGSVIAIAYLALFVLAIVGLVIASLLLG